jgi:hypothetical protein
VQLVSARSGKPRCVVKQVTCVTALHVMAASESNWRCRWWGHTWGAVSNSSNVCIEGVTRQALPHVDFKQNYFETCLWRWFTSWCSCAKVRGCIQKFPDWVITKYTLTIINTRWEARQRVMAAKLTRLTHKIAIYLNLVAESCTICSSRSRRPVRKLLDTPSC